MSFIKKIFDIKKCARALHRHPGRPVAERDPDALTPEDINPMLHPVYIQILREHSFNIAELDFAGIGEGDIDELENVLYYSPATGSLISARYSGSLSRRARIKESSFEEALYVFIFDVQSASAENVSRYRHF